MMLEIADDAALVLFAFLAREIDEHKAKRLATVIDHPAEFWALNAVHCGLERILSEPFAPNYRELVAIARDSMIARCDPDGTYGPIGGAH
jgi:hypothetical protein